MPAAAPRRSRPRRTTAVTVEGAAWLPIAQVMIDSSLPHLDHPFDYLVPEAMSATAVAGARVRVRFAGRLTNGIIVDRIERPEHEGDVRPLERVVGTEPVLTVETLPLISAVAERYAGTFSDVVRAAVPPRHARADAVRVAPADWQADADTSHRARWTAYAGGGALVDRLSAPAASPTRAVWSCAPATSWAKDVAALALTVLSHTPGGVLVVVPDATEVDRLVAQLGTAREAGVLATLTADQGPERRYREYLRVLRGGARIVVGTRGAVFAPVADLRLIVVWDDGDDALVDPQAPYWDARDVAALRSHATGCDLVVGSPARSVHTQQWCETRWARSLEPTRATLTTRAPLVRALQADDAARDEASAVARIPHHAWEVARAAVRDGPVLVQVGRRGYVPALACQSCREVARCSCGGPLQLTSGGTVPACSWCGALAGSWTCPSCGSNRLRAVAVGAERTAEEIGRAFPGVRVVASHGGRVLAAVPDEPCVVVATWGAEPTTEPGYRAVVILDARAPLQRPTLDATEDAVRRWFAAARLAVPRAPVVVTADNALAPVQALVRWDAPWLARRELSERAAAGLPPATRVTALLGAAGDIGEVVSALTVPHRLLGPVPLRTHRDGVDAERERGLVVVDRGNGVELARELRAITMVRSARARTGVVHVVIDPRDI